MRKLIALLLILGLSVGLSLLAVEDSGFVVLGRQGWTLETSLALFGFLLVLVFLVFYLLLRLLSLLWGLPERMQLNLQLRRYEKRHQAVLNGFMLMQEGQWRKAEQALLKGDPEPLQYLAAAYAAQQQADTVNRDEYLSLAKQDLPAEQLLAARLLEARLRIQQQAYTDALGILKELQAQQPKHGGILSLSKDCYCGLQNWEGLEALLPDLRKRKILPDVELDELEQKVLVNQLKLAGEQSPQAQNTVWNKLLKLQRLLPQVACFYAHALWQRSDASTAEAVLRDSLKHQWYAPAVKLYGLVDADAGSQLGYAEKWLKGREKDPLLLATLARLCLRSRLLGKAQQYLDQSLSWQPTMEAYQVSGELQMELGENARAAEFYLKGLELVHNPCVNSSV